MIWYLGELSLSPRSKLGRKSSSLRRSSDDFDGGCVEEDGVAAFEVEGLPSFVRDDDLLLLAGWYEECLEEELFVSFLLVLVSASAISVPLMFMISFSTTGDATGELLGEKAFVEGFPLFQTPFTTKPLSYCNAPDP